MLGLDDTAIIDLSFELLKVLYDSDATSWSHPDSFDIDFNLVFDLFQPLVFQVLIQIWVGSTLLNYFLLQLAQYSHLFLI